MKGRVIGLIHKCLKAGVLENGAAAVTDRREGRPSTRRAVTKMKDKPREITGRSWGIGYETMKTGLGRVIVGWVQYFSLEGMKTRMAEMDRWLRRRIRMCYWKMWKLPKT